MTPVAIDPETPVSEPTPDIASFKDGTGREWILELSVGLIKKIKKDTGVDFDLFIKDAKRMASIITEEPHKLVECLWVMCEGQATAMSVSPEEFGRLFTRKIIDPAANALLMSVVLFYPRASAGRILAGKMPELLAKMDATITAKTTSQVQSMLSNMPNG